MIYGEHRFGMFNDLRVFPALADTGVGLIVIRIEMADEILTRADVERLRDLCEEALS